MDLSLDYFSNFAIPRSFEVDLPALAERHRQLQQQYHPDRYAAASAAERRVAVQIASYLNQAYGVLRSPLRRAIYLLELEGLEPLAPTNTSMPMDFLMQQMALRESMEEISESADPEAALDDLADQLQSMHRQLQQAFAQSYGAASYAEAEVVARKLQFIDKLQQELDDLEGRLLD